MQEKTFVCKYCLREFVCGKSLGGHLRTHMMIENEERRMNAANAAAAASVFKFDDGRKRKRSELGSSGGVGGGGGDDGSYIYGLRENPKKTTRFVHSNAAAAAAVSATVQMEKFCKECGKGFPSLKALCGHMASHSEKEKVINRIEGVSGVLVGEKEKLVLDSQSDTEESVPTDTRKSKRMKFKNVNGGNDNRRSSSSPTWGNCSSSISEVDKEHEEVARTLMMLSRDYSFKGRFALGTDSSDNNSVVVEAKSKSKTPSVDDTKVIAMNVNHGKSISIVGTEKKNLNKDRKLKVYDIGYDSDNSDSGYFLFGPKKVESDASSEWCLKNRFEDHGFESSKKIISGGGKSRNSDEFKGPNYDKNIVENSNRKNIQNGYGTDEMYDSLKIERESFSDDSVYESDENSTDSDSYTAPKNQSNNKNMNGTKSNKKSSCKGKKKMKSKKSKEHECPICNKTFRSGQALGGHKRSHFVGGYDENTLVLRPSAANPVNPAPAAVNPAAPAAVNPCLIDLNLPAPDEE